MGNFLSILQQMMARRRARASASTFDLDAIAFFDVNTGLTQTQKEAINQLVVSLKAANIWSRLIAVYPMVGGTAAAHKWNLKNPLDTDTAKRLEFFGGWTHSSTGAKPNGSNGYAKTFIDCHEDCPQYSFHGSYYSRENVAPGGSDYYLFGGKYTGGGMGLDFYNVSRIFGDVGAAPTVLTVTSQTVFSGLFTLTCYHNNVIRIYRGATQLGVQNANRYAYFPNINPDSNAGKLYIGAYNNNETPAFYSSYECGFASFGWGMDGTMVTAFNAAVTNFLTTLNRL